MIVNFPNVQNEISLARWYKVAAFRWYWSNLVNYIICRVWIQNIMHLYLFSWLRCTNNSSNISYQVKPCALENRDSGFNLLDKVFDVVCFEFKLVIIECVDTNHTGFLYSIWILFRKLKVRPTFVCSKLDPLSARYIKYVSRMIK